MSDWMVCEKNNRKIHNLNTNKEWLRLKITMPNVIECEKNELNELFDAVQSKAALTHLSQLTR